MVKFPHGGPQLLPQEPRATGLEFPRQYGFPSSPATDASTELTKRLTGEWPGRPGGVPGIDVDAAQPDAVPVAPRQSTDDRRYETYVAMPGYGVEQMGNRAALGPGDSWVIQSTFVPDFWRVANYGNGITGYLLVDVNGSGVGAMAILPANATQTFPARGYRLALVAADENSGDLVVSVEAYAALSSTGAK